MAPNLIFPSFRIKVFVYDTIIRNAMAKCQYRILHSGLFCFDQTERLKLRLYNLSTLISPLSPQSHLVVCDLCTESLALHCVSAKGKLLVSSTEFYTVPPPILPYPLLYSLCALIECSPHDSEGTSSYSGSSHIEGTHGNLRDQRSIHSTIKNQLTLNPDP